MTKASASLIVLLFASLMASFHTLAQSGDVLSERVHQTFRSHTRLSLGNLLRLSPHEMDQYEVRSITVMARAAARISQLEILINGRSTIQPQQLTTQARQIRLSPPPGQLLSAFDLMGQGDIYIESVTAEVSRIFSQPRPGPRPGHRPPQRPDHSRLHPARARSVISLSIDQDVRGMGSINLERLVEVQRGITLVGAEIESVEVIGASLRFGSTPSVQLEVNNRPMSEDALLRNVVSFNLRYPEEVRRGLDLRVRGDARIQVVNIRIGQVRPQGHYPGHSQVERVFVGRELSARFPLDLARLMPYENRMVRSIAIEGRAQSYQVQVSLMGFYGQMGSVLVSHIPMKPVIYLHHPEPLRDLRLESYASVHITALEIEFERY